MLENLIQEIGIQTFGSRWRLDRCQVVSGGDISQAFKITDQDGATYFLKTHQKDLFTTEAAALQQLALAAEGSLIQIPQVFAHQKAANGQYFLLLQWIERGRDKAGQDFESVFGENLAILHCNKKAKTFGWDQDNWIGSNPQKNEPNSSWNSFFVENRLKPQIKWAVENGLGDRFFNEKGQRVCEYSMKFLEQSDSQPCLIHGDLWSGNFFPNSAGHPVLIDPAVYFADPEAELGMTTLFGGLGSQFYSAYRSVIPEQEGSAQRIRLYRLYHVLNHLNLFGSSYLRQSIDLMDEVLNDC